MDTPGRSKRCLFAGYMLLTNCLLFWGCPQPPAEQPPQTEQLPPRYPSVVYSIPRCYDDPIQPKESCKDWSRDLYLSLPFLETKSDSVLWKDITGMLKHSKAWRLNVFRASTGDIVGGTYQKDKNTTWKPISDPKVRLEKLPEEVLLRADFEFCSSDNCDDDSAKIEGRSINFLMHEFPEKT